MPRPICFRLFTHWVRRAASRAAWTAGKSNAISTAMVAMTTSNSIRVKARLLMVGSLPLSRPRRPYEVPGSSASVGRGGAGPASSARAARGRPAHLKGGSGRVPRPVGERRAHRGRDACGKGPGPTGSTTQAGGRAGEETKGGGVGQGPCRGRTSGRRRPRGGRTARRRRAGVGSPGRRDTDRGREPTRTGTVPVQDPGVVVVPPHPARGRHGRGPRDEQQQDDLQKHPQHGHAPI